MKERSKKEEYKKTQSTSSPGTGGENVNRDKNKVTTAKKNSINDTAQDEGLNEEKSAGSGGAFEGFENTDE